GEDGIRDWSVTGVQTCALPIYRERQQPAERRRHGEQRIGKPVESGAEITEAEAPAGDGGGARMRRAVDQQDEAGDADRQDRYRVDRRQSEDREGGEEERQAARAPARQAGQPGPRVRSVAGGRSRQWSRRAITRPRIAGPPARAIGASTERSTIVHRRRRQVADLEALDPPRIGVDHFEDDAGRMRDRLAAG